MKRTLKNIIMFIILTLCIGGFVLTGYFAHKNYSSSNASDNNMMQMNNNGGTPPSMPSGDNQTTGGNSGSSDMTPPEKPDGDTTNGSSSSTDSTTPPEKPDGDTATNNTNSDNSTSTENSNSSNENTMTPPEKPDGENSDSSNATMPGDQGQMNQNGINPMEATSSESNELSVIYYVIYIGISIVFSIILIYLIVSKFNLLTLKEVFGCKRAIVLILVSILLAGGLSFGSIFVTNKYLINNSTSSSSSSNAPGNMGGTSDSSNVTYTASKEITSDGDISDGEYESTDSDSNAILVSGDVTSNISGVTVTKTGDSDGGDSTSFYGNNSAILAKGGANVTIKNATVTTDATGANGIFSYGGSATTNNSSSDGTTVNIYNSTITTKKDNSGGIMTTGGGVTNAYDLTVTTSGVSSAAIRSDRGGGTVTVSGGTYETNGAGSPAIYSTAKISVSDATLLSNVSEGVVIEGMNSVTLDNVTLTDTNNKLNGQSTTYKNIFLYQSMSGDASDGTSSFSATDSTITTNKGDTLYVTNTSATIYLKNNTITNNDSTGNFLRIQKDSWGTSGSNGGSVDLTMDNQKVVGNIVVDSISTLDMTLKSSSYFEGVINQDNEAKEITLTLDNSSSIKLLGDCYVTSLDDSDSSYSNIDFNGYKLYVNGEAIN